MGNLCLKGFKGVGYGYFDFEKFNNSDENLKYIYYKNTS